MDTERVSHFEGGFDPRTDHERAIDAGEKEPSVSAEQMIDNLYPLIRETTDPNELKAMVEAWKHMDLEELGPDWSEGIRELVIGIVLDQLAMPPLNEFDYVLGEMNILDSYALRRMGSALGWMARRGDEGVFGKLQELYPGLDPTAKNAILLNLLPVMGGKESHKRKFLLEHVDDLHDSAKTQDVLTLARSFEEHQEIEAAAQRTMQS